MGYAIRVAASSQANLAILSGLNCTEILLVTIVVKSPTLDRSSGLSLNASVGKSVQPQQTHSKRIRHPSDYKTQSPESVFDSTESPSIEALAKANSLLTYVTAA